MGDDLKLKRVNKRMSLNSTMVFGPVLKRTILTTHEKISFVSGHGIKVAIIDSGVNNDVEVNERKDLTGFGVHDEIPGTHGTHVAAIIKHFAKNAEIISIKVTRTRNNIDWGRVFVALKMARDIGASIVNLSMGNYNKDHNIQCKGKCQICKEVDSFVKMTGMTVVVAAGNDGPNDGSINCPAVLPSVVSVGALNYGGTNIAHFSSRSFDGGSVRPDLVTSGHVKRNDLTADGTSFAAPVITGVLAAAFSAYPSEKEKIIKLLLDSCSKLPAPIHHQGHGALNLQRFVEEISNEENIFGHPEKQGHGG